MRNGPVYDSLRNFAVEQTAGSRSLAAAAHRERSADNGEIMAWSKSSLFRPVSDW